MFLCGKKIDYHIDSLDNIKNHSIQKIMCPIFLCGQKRILGIYLFFPLKFAINNRPGENPSCG